MNLESKNFSPQIPPEKKRYKLDRGGEYKVFEKKCTGCEWSFSIYVPNKDSNIKLGTKNGGKIFIKELEEQAKARMLCPECEKKQANQNNTEQ